MNQGSYIRGAEIFLWLSFISVNQKPAYPAKADLIKTKDMAIVRLCNWQ